jgi:hypothetical protein
VPVLELRDRPHVQLAPALLQKLGSLGRSHSLGHGGSI